MKNLDTLHWIGGIDGHLAMIDQTLLPIELKEIECRDVKTVWEAIKMLRVRGAPAIGIAAAYGICIGLQTVAGTDSREVFFARLDEVADYLASSRPTAVNLFWAIERMKASVEAYRDGGDTKTSAQIAQRLLDEARAIHEEDREICRRMGRHGAELLSDGQTVLTHCNAGGLATADYGTALAVIYAAVESGKKIHAYADETRPLLQGARLTAW
ncbi:MAG: S-methyl-5-thioribose-1-phosphate isomerase, partial [Pirellulales bacterium]|nr:S-methyl-5-thioribose-1-phosphate isomerase [Pirellulales bacterium]